MFGSFKKYFRLPTTYFATVIHFEWNGKQTILVLSRIFFVVFLPRNFNLNILLMLQKS